jgi:hypothetical protein
LVAGAAMTINSLSDVTEFPLCWPENKARCSERSGSLFKANMTKARAEIDTEMGRWKAIDYVVSCAPAYRRGPTDPGVALWWSMRAPSGPTLRVLACDQYKLAEANAHAIALTLEALRGCARWGAYSEEQAIEGARLALPAPDAAGLNRPWHEILGVAETVPLAVCDAAYRALAKQRQGDHRQMVELNLAIEAARAAKR